LPEPKYVIVYI